MKVHGLPFPQNETIDAEILSDHKMVRY